MTATHKREVFLHIEDPPDSIPLPDLIERLQGVLDNAPDEKRNHLRVEIYGYGMWGIEVFAETPKTQDEIDAEVEEERRRKENYREYAISRWSGSKTAPTKRTA